MGPDEAYARARDELLEEIAERAALRAARRDSGHAGRTYRAIAITRRSRSRSRTLPTNARLAERLATRRGAAGDRGKARWRQSAVSQQPAVGRRTVCGAAAALVGGFCADLENGRPAQGICHQARSRTNGPTSCSRSNRGRYGKPGITKDAQALEIAKIVRKWQKQSMAMLNREGAWVRSYSGYVTRTSHDPHAIGNAGMEQVGQRHLRQARSQAHLRHAMTARPRSMRCARCGRRCDPATISITASRSRSRCFRASPSKASATRELHFKTGEGLARL